MTLLDAIADETRSAFVKEFAEQSIYTPAGGAPSRLQMVFDRQSEVTDVGELIQLDGVAASARIETAKAPNLALGDMMAVRGTTYIVRGVEPDGTGVTVVILGL